MSENPVEITPAEAQSAAQAGTAVLIDVRSDAEWQAGHIPGALHIELTALSERVGELPPDAELIFQCRVGGRSLMAADAFRASGRSARSLAGGALAWVEAGLPFDGVVAEH